MRTTWCFGVAAALPMVLSGCLADVLVSTAIQGELQAKNAQAAVKALNNAKEFKSETEINSAIQAFAAENGRNPASLEELVPTYFTSVPVKPDGSPWGYDPTTGKLLDAPVAPAVAAPHITETNEQKIARIKQAVAAYGQATGYYPGTLEALVPAYLPSVPLTAKGARFIYDNQTGNVFDPTGTVLDVPAPAGGGGNLAQSPQQGVPQQQQAGTGGGSPVLGETLTGIGISNQLDNMSSAGSSAASSRARGGARGIAESHDANQQRAMDELGL